MSNKVDRLYKRIKSGIQFMLAPQNYYMYKKDIYNFHIPFFSQEGEDAILARFFDHQETGFYIDVGAHHPQRFSNTYYFYLKGWHGINIDAMPGSMTPFHQLRPRDVNVEMAISNSNRSLTYYQFNEPALNGFSKELSCQRNEINHAKLIAKVDMSTCTLSQLLERYLPVGQDIDFLTIDVEGLDFEVLASNDWQKYRPKMILTEELRELALDSLQDLPTVIFLQKQQYKFWAKTVNTYFFIDTTTNY